MSHMSMRVRSVALYAYTAPQDAASEIAESTYTRVPSSDPDGLWWAARGVPMGKQTHPTTAAQQVTEARYQFASEVPVTPTSLLVDDGEYWKVTAVLPREIGRDELQVLAVRVDDDAAGFDLVEPEPEPEP
jgi:hypothetical protein